jgi:hypothetical protein
MDVLPTQKNAHFPEEIEKATIIIVLRMSILKALQKPKKRSILYFSNSQFFPNGVWYMKKWGDSSRQFIDI